MSLSLVAWGPWEDAVSWLLAAQAVSISSIYHCSLSLVFEDNWREAGGKLILLLEIPDIGSNPNELESIGVVTDERSLCFI